VEQLVEDIEALIDELEKQLSKFCPVRTGEGFTWELCPE
jgi:hypothetical protein